MVRIEKLKELGEKIANEISQCPEVKAVAYTGSLASGFADKYTEDVDLVALCEERPSVKKRRKYLGDYDFKPKDSAGPYIEPFKLGGVGIDIAFKEISELKNAINSLPSYDEGREKHMLFVLQNMKPIVDSENVIENLKNNLSYPNPYKKNKIKREFWVLCNAKHALKNSIKRNDRAFINYKFGDLLERYVSVIFSLNERFYSNLKWTKEIFNQFDLVPENAIENIHKISEKGDRPEEAKEKLKILKRMLKDLYNLIKQDMPNIDLKEDLKKLESW